MPNNTTIVFLVLFFTLAALAGLYAAIRIVRAGGRPVRDSQLPTLRSPGIPIEFVSGEWNTL